MQGSVSPKKANTGSEESSAGVRGHQEPAGGVFSAKFHPAFAFENPLWQPDTQAALPGPYRERAQIAR